MDSSIIYYILATIRIKKYVDIGTVLIELCFFERIWGKEEFLLANAK